jgi:hypothetical protein
METLSQVFFRRFFAAARYWGLTSKELGRNGVGLEGVTVSDLLLL